MGNFNMVAEHKLVKVEIDKIKIDSTNPNVMSEDEMAALQKTMDKFGYLAPVILDKKYKVVDGEHRVRVYEKQGKKTIPAYVIDVDKYDQKILRQVMNKLRGEHDLLKDSKEFNILEKANKLDDLAGFLAKDEKDFLRMAEKVDSQVGLDKGGTPEDMEDHYLHGNIKQITIFFDNAEFEKVMPILEKIMEAEEVTTHTDVFYKLLEFYENNKLNKT